ncbi:MULTISPECIES: glycosyltransferase [Rhodococcus]|uniref:glycosyltransferase n=1 Tax=Rhodococcus TaxID=1827 RepID=UPI000F521FE7|nr:glycosyltransferase [Rhodococcus ruber]QRE79383.1 glycosyltransferase family 2 protein [Rhodococcus ruber]RQM34061.1 glycosyl transferase [Rhodococcus ruber]
MNRPAPVSANPGVDRAATGQLDLQRGLFTGTSPIVNDGLYAVLDGGGRRERFALHLDDGARAHTNTYFGRFAASYWQRWTTVTDVRVTFRIATAGTCRIRLAASDIAGHRRIVDTQEATGDGIVTMSCALDRFVDGGALWLEFDAVGAAVDIDDVRWAAPAPEVVRPVAVAICTFNRADDCAATVTALASDDEVLSSIEALYVVDQGTDPVADREQFARVAERFGDRLHYLRQPNLGGAGGFTRGLYEVSATGADTDIILMDDDILCEPETVLRLSAFANCTVEPTLVGAQMLYLLNPDYLNVGAEEVDFATLQHGRRVSKALYNTSMLERNQERRVDAGYNAWWTCLIPSRVVAEIGLPLPIFFQWDDVEYGVRARGAGYATVTLPNAAVWHADFYWKDYDDWARYFSTRNALVVGALHSDLDAKALSKQYFRNIVEFLVAMQYGLAATTLRGIEDFLRGPSVLDDGGLSTVPQVRAERAAYPETVNHPAAKAPVHSAELMTRRSPGEPSLMRTILVKRAIDQWFGRTVPGLAAVPREDAYWWHVSKFDCAVVTDASQSGVRIRQRDKEVAKQLLMRTVKVLRRLRAEAPRLQDEYRAAFPQLTSRDNWARIFEQGTEPESPSS